MSHVLQPGSEPVPGYKLVNRLGKGGFGEVWKATGPGGFQVALKFVALDGRVGPAELRALEVIRDIRHPHLLASFGSWQEEGRLVIAMELADRTLFDRLSEAVGQGFPGIPEPEIFEHFLDTAEALDFLNEPRHPTGAGGPQRIQHRDVKPQNLLLVGDRVKVADFGLARVLEHTTTGHTGSYTTAYAAPEFFNEVTSIYSDQYCLAITYCHLRGGRLPFEGNHAAIMHGHLMREPDLSMIPEAERPAVARALSKAPRDRWPSCRAFIQAVMAADGVESEPVIELDLPISEGPTQPEKATGGVRTRPNPFLDSESSIDLDLSISVEPTQPDEAAGGAPTKPDPIPELAHAEPPSRERSVYKIAAWALAAAVLLIAAILLLARNKPEVAVASKTPDTGNPDTKSPGLAKQPDVAASKAAPAITTKATVDEQGKSSAPHAPSNTPQAPSPRQASEPAFVPLFNGKNLSGWRLTGNLNHNWRVTPGGVLEGSGPPTASHLVTERSDFSNFHIRVETKLSEGSNSGIRFFLTDDVEESINYLALIAGTNEKVDDTGSLNIFDRGASQVSLAKADPVIPIKPGEWFTEEVIVDGNVITVIVKGIVVAKFRLFSRKSTFGAIGLMCRGGSKVAFRKVEIKKLIGTSATGSAESSGESGTAQQPPDLGHVARRYGGDFWQIEGDELIWTQDNRPARMYFGNPAWTDYSFSADVKLSQDSPVAGLIFRQGQSGEEYRFAANKGGSWISRLIDQQLSTLKDQNSHESQLKNGRWQSMRIEARREKFTAYLNGRFVCEASDPSLTRGNVGFVVEGACRFRNIRVIAPNGKILWEGLPELPTASLYGVSLKGDK